MKTAKIKPLENFWLYGTCISYSGKFSLGEKIRHFRQLLTLAKIYSAKYFPCVNDYIRGFGDLYLVKIKCSCNTRVGAFGKIFLPQNIIIQYM